MHTKLRNAIITALALVGLIAPAIALAASTPTLNQTVNAGTISTDILGTDDSTPVASPTVSFTALNRSFLCQTSTGTLGDTNNRLYVTNFAGGASWNLTIAATTGATAKWTSGGNNYAFNDAAGSGCTNGQLTVNPAVGTVTPNCNSVCDGVTVSKGSSTAFVSGSADSVTLMSASSGAAWKGYIAGISLSQKVPAQQVAGSYSLGMTLTATAQ
jgi:hypothetical protein